MTNLTTAQLGILRAAYENPTTAYPAADFYRILADFGEQLAGAEEAAILWLRGAAEVNENSGTQSDFIRGYNKAQYEARYGGTLSDSRMDAVSNAIAKAIFDQVVGTIETPGTGIFPSLDSLATNDAQPAAALLFRGDPGGWAGNHLFLALGHTDAFYNNIVEAGSSTYDAIALVKFTYEAFSSGNIFDSVSQLINYPSGYVTVGFGELALNSFLSDPTFPK